MKIKTLKKNHLRKNIIISIIIIAITSTIILNFTRAKYKTTQSIPLVNGTINYKPYDFKMIAMYQQNENEEYEEIDIMPSSGFVINEEKSYCMLNSETKDENAKLYTNSSGEHTIANLQKGTKCYIYFDKYKTSLAKEQILSNYSTILTRNDFSSVVTAATTGTIYQAEDDYGTTYYFAGNPTDNWVSFAGFYWRIIRINGDGTIRLIYQGSSANTTGTGTQINTSTFNSNYNASYYVGLKYGTNQHGTTTNSTILTTLNMWYSNNLFGYADKLDGNTGFCGDRQMANGYAWNATPSNAIYYAGYERLVQNNSTVKPTFKCTNSNDLYTTSESTNGNKALTYPIGLITADEVIYGGLSNNSTTSNYLYTGQNYWTMSPYFAHKASSYVFYVYASGYLSTFNTNVNSSYGVRPVINLKADVTISSGNGTSSNPYIITS